jgi:hypothetical protein
VSASEYAEFLEDMIGKMGLRVKGWKLADDADRERKGSKERQEQVLEVAEEVEEEEAEEEAPVVESVGIGITATVSINAEDEVEENQPVSYNQRSSNAAAVAARAAVVAARAARGNF